MEENKELRSLHTVPGRLKGLQSTARPVQSRKSACCRLRISFGLVFPSLSPPQYISPLFNPFHSLLALSCPSQLRLKRLKVASASAQLQHVILLSPFWGLSSSDTWSARFHSVTLRCSPVTLLLFCMSVAGKRSPVQLLMHKVMDNKLFVINCDSLRQQQQQKHHTSTAQNANICTSRCR